MRSKWLIEGIAHRSATLIYGPPKATKSAVANTIGAAVVGDGDWFLGRRVTRHGPVAVISTDPNGNDESAGRFPADVPSSKVHLHEGIPEWPQHPSELRDRGIVLAIYDNLNGLLPPGADVNSPTGVRTVIDPLNRVIALGISVILIHHTAKPMMGNSRRTPLGSQYIAGWARQLIRIE